MVVTQLTPNFHQIKIPYSAANKEFYFLLSADHHWDNPDSDREMIKRHLEMCKERNAKAIIVGDFFCAMQGKYDKRSDKSKLRPEHQVTRYLDALVNTAAEWLMPYREQIAVIGYGNHETAIINRHETDLIERLVERLNAGISDTDHKVYKGGYGGYIRLYFEHESGGQRKSLLIKYFHGHGGGGEVTKGLLQSQRRAVYTPDADIIISGHVHEQYIIPFTQEKTTDSGKVYLREQWHVRIPTYKDEYKQGAGGWHIETGKPPKPLGAWWLRVEPTRSKDENRTMQLNFDFLKAK